MAFPSALRYTCPMANGQKAIAAARIRRFAAELAVKYKPERIIRGLRKIFRESMELEKTGSDGRSGK